MTFFQGEVDGTKWGYISYKSCRKKINLSIQIFIISFSSATDINLKSKEKSKTVNHEITKLSQDTLNSVINFHFLLWYYFPSNCLLISF